MKSARWLLLIAVVAVSTTCGGTTEPVSGWVDLQLTTPNSGDGGIVFTVGGGQVDSVRSNLPRLFTNQLSETSWKVLVAGNVTSGVIAQIHVPDVGKLGGYAATPVEVAGQDFAERSTSGYSITVQKGTSQ
jgi:hypothetical protein